MPLRFDLGPWDKLYIGKSVLSNGHERAYFVLEGETPVLRAKDVIQQDIACNSLERLYCCIQRIYLEEAFTKYQGSYLALMVDAVKEEPSRHPDVKQVDDLVKGGECYRALKRLKRLIRREAFAVDKSEPKTYVRRVAYGRK